jgi:hypothetical protein
MGHEAQCTAVADGCQPADASHARITKFSIDLSGICFHLLLKINASKFTRGWEPLQGDARSAKSFKVSTLISSTDCSPIDWLQSVLTITRFENVFLFISFLKIRRHVRGGVKLD